MSLPSGEWARLRIVLRPFVTRSYLAAHPEPKLHLGCGRRRLPGWLNADKFSMSSDIYLDAYARFPFADATFRAVLCEHMIEHVRIDRVRFVLAEIRRVLLPGGVLRISCPDLETYARRYVAGDQAFFDRVDLAISGRRGSRPDTTWVVRGPGGGFMTGATANFHGHRWMYDHATLASCLREVGFGEVRRARCGEGMLAEVAACDDPDRAFESLYVDAIR